MVASYKEHYRDYAEGHIFLDKEGASTITLTGASAMSQKELNKWGQLFSASPEMLTAIKNLLAHYENGDVEDCDFELCRHAIANVKGKRRSA